MIGQVFGHWTVLSDATGASGGQTRWRCRCVCGAERDLIASQVRHGHTKSCGCVKPGTVLPTVGQRFSRLAVERVYRRAEGGWWVACRCDCGETTEVAKGNLLSGSIKSCGCLAEEMVGDYAGTRFGKWSVLARASAPDGQHGFAFWFCRCDCGTERVVVGYALRRGKSLSCGCDVAERISAAMAEHGMTDSPEWETWSSMRRRCYDPSMASYDNYGGRGIRVCDRWLDSFENFYADMGTRPSDKHSIDRINNDGNYEPDNCRWATWTEQANNRRSTVRLPFRGRTLSTTEWAEVIGIHSSTILARLRDDWSIEEALTTPIRKQKNNRRA